MRARLTAVTGALVLGGTLALLSSQGAAQAAGGACAAYTYTDTGADLCGKFGGSGDVDCPEVAAPVTLVGDADPWNLDADGNGTGCETQPGAGEPKPTPTKTSSPKPTASPSKSVKPKPSPTKTRATEAAVVPVAGPQLPVTGPAGPWVAGGALALAAVGGLAVVVVRRRRTRFVA